MKQRQDHTILENLQPHLGPIVSSVKADFRIEVNLIYLIQTVRSGSKRQQCTGKPQVAVRLWEPNREGFYLSLIYVDN